MSKARRVAVGVAAVVLLGVTARPVAAQSATALLFYGGALADPVLVTGADAAAFSNVTARAAMTASELGDRPFVSVALYWGPRQDPANNGTRDLSALKPAMAWQHGRFYPAVAGKPAMLLTTVVSKRAQPVPAPAESSRFVWGGPVPASALAVLQRLGVAAR